MLPRDDAGPPGFYNVDNNINNRKDNKRNNTIIIRWLDEKDTVVRSRNESYFQTSFRDATTAVEGHGGDR